MSGPRPPGSVTPRCRREQRERAAAPRSGRGMAAGGHGRCSRDPPRRTARGRAPPGRELRGPDQVCPPRPSTTEFPALGTAPTLRVSGPRPSHRAPHPSDGDTRRPQPGLEFKRGAAGAARPPIGRFEGAPQRRRARCILGAGGGAAGRRRAAPVRTASARRWAEQARAPPRARGGSAEARGGLLGAPCCVLAAGPQGSCACQGTKFRSQLFICKYRGFNS